MNAREYKSTAVDAAQAGRYDRAQVYATLYLGEQVAELIKLIEPIAHPLMKLDAEPPKRVKRNLW